MSVSQAHLTSGATRRAFAIDPSEVRVMVMSRIQFQPELSMPDFLKDYDTESQCEQVLEAR
jgi:hypothetical protein